MKWSRALAPGLLAAAIVIAVLMAATRAIPHGHRYDLAVKLSLALGAFWFLAFVKPEWAFKKTVLIVVGLAALGLAIGEISVINPNSEIVQVYDSVFRAIRNGLNPYTSGTIFHYAEYWRPVYGNFNYPPLEIYPYYLAYRLAGTWNSTVMTSAFLVIQGLVCMIFMATFPGVKRRYILPFCGLFLFMEIITNVAMTFLVTALILLAVKNDEPDPRPGRRFLTAGLFGAGLMTKFLIIPFMAAYYWRRVDPKKPASLLRVAPDIGAALGTAALIALPFGLVPVFKNTILFNLILKDRAVFTTFFPNVVSGPLSWLGLGRVYPLAAVAALGASILAARRLRLASALMAAGCAFLFVTVTPEPQYIPVMLYLALFAVYLETENARPGILRPVRREAPA